MAFLNSVYVCAEGGVSYRCVMHVVRVGCVSACIRVEYVYVITHHLRVSL